MKHTAHTARAANAHLYAQICCIHNQIIHNTTQRERAEYPIAVMHNIASPMASACTREHMLEYYVCMQMANRTRWGFHQNSIFVSERCALAFDPPQICFSHNACIHEKQNSLIEHIFGTNFPTSDSRGVWVCCSYLCAFICLFRNTFITKTKQQKTVAAIHPAASRYYNAISL